MPKLKSADSVSELALARIAYPVTSLGPGRRLALWTAGCCRRCRGCISPDILVARPEHRIEVNRVIERIVAVGASLEGLTLSGGDPLDQPEGITVLIDALKTHFPEWNVISYTGHRLESLQQQPTTAAALQRIDLLIDGDYRARQPSPHPLIGSANQRLLPLNKTGEALLQRIEAEREQAPHFNLARGDGTEALLVGVGTAQSRAHFHKKAGLRPWLETTKQNCAEITTAATS